MEKRFTDNGGTSRVMIEGNGAPLGGDFENNRYVIANHISKNSNTLDLVVMDLPLLQHWHQLLLLLVLS